MIFFDFGSNLTCMGRPFGALQWWAMRFRFLHMSSIISKQRCLYIYFRILSRMCTAPPHWQKIGKFQGKENQASFLILSLLISSSFIIQFKNHRDITVVKIISQLTNLSLIQMYQLVPFFRLGAFQKSKNLIRIIFFWLLDQNKLLQVTLSLAPKQCLSLLLVME